MGIGKIPEFLPVAAPPALLADLVRQLPKKLICRCWQSRGSDEGEHVMKIVVYGADKRVGALRDGSVIDLSAAFAKYLHEAKGEVRATEIAAALVPSDLAQLIEGGKRALDDAQKALEHLASKAQSLTGVNGEAIVFPASTVKIHAPRPNGTRMACAGSNPPAASPSASDRALWPRDLKAPFIRPEGQRSDRSRRGGETHPGRRLPARL